MSNPNFYRLDAVAVLDITGDDAGTIVHNVTTNDVKGLQIGEGCETFITDVRGKTLGHGFLYREPDRLRMIGAAGQSESLAAHLDRYTIREDATPSIRDDEFGVIVLSHDAAEQVGISTSEDTLSKTVWESDDVSVAAYQTRWLGPGTIVLLFPICEAQRICSALERRQCVGGDETQFQQARTIAGFPWYGIDIDDSNLPQEADRDSLAVSFTKGCYLGQETVARLDALGQVQKKLVRWSITGHTPPANAKLLAGEKPVGRLTSVAADHDGGALAIGFARRSHFDSGATATGVDEKNGTEFLGTVL